MSPEASMSTCGPPAPPAGPVGSNWTADVWLESFANWLTKAWGTSPSCHHTAAASPRPSTATRGQEAPVAIGVPIGSGSGGLHPEASAKAEDQRLIMLSFHSSHTARRRPSPVMHTRDPPAPEPAGLRVTGDDQGPSGGPRPSRLKAPLVAAQTPIAVPLSNSTTSLAHPVPTAIGDSQPVNRSMRLAYRRPTSPPLTGSRSPWAHTTMPFPRSSIAVTIFTMRALSTL